MLHPERGLACRYRDPAACGVAQEAAALTEAALALAGHELDAFTRKLMAEMTWGELAKWRPGGRTNHRPLPRFYCRGQPGGRPWMTGAPLVGDGPTQEQRCRLAATGEPVRELAS